ncbi:MAG: hypothetical protein J7L88_01690 [Thermoplasmata archaeon]|nr:hypothetical protein [Thermoplasmata archaeon]
MGTVEPVDIAPEKAGEFLDSLKEAINSHEGIKVHFHNDMDGLNSALILREAFTHLTTDKPIAFAPLDHTEMTDLTLADGILHLFLDINRERWERGNVVVIDHHLPDVNMRLIDERHFILSPPEGNHIKTTFSYPSCTALLAAYLLHIVRGGDMSFLEYVSSHPFQENRYLKLLLHLAALSDNLWQLSRKGSLLKEWVGSEERERGLLLLSISASLLLGEKDKRGEIIGELFSSPGDADKYITVLSQMLNEADLLDRISVKITEESIKFIGEIYREAEQNISLYQQQLQNVRSRLSDLLKTRPQRLKELPIENWERDKERWEIKRKELKESEKHTISEEERKRLLYYVEEILNLKRQEQIASEGLRSASLRLKASHMVLHEIKVPPMLVYLPRQSSAQVKGILASLLYLHGWRNIIMEERGPTGVWGSRGFEREVLKELLSTLTLDREELRRYLGEENIVRTLMSEINISYSINIEKAITFSFRYTGGLGGRGLTYGGEISGFVPFLFALLEEGSDEKSTIEKKIRELARHKQLGLALKGLTEGESMVPVIKALKDKLKRKGFLVVQPIGFTEDADLIKGNFSHLLLYFMGGKKRAEFTHEREKLPDLHAIL